MPIYEYECTVCKNIDEHIVLKPVTESYCRCSKCKQISVKQMSAPKFRVTGFNAANGYNLPLYSDVIDKDGKAKPKWSRD